MRASGGCVQSGGVFGWRESTVRKTSMTMPMSPGAALAPLVLREIAFRLLTGPQGAKLRQIASAGAPAQRIASHPGPLRREGPTLRRVDRPWRWLPNGLD